MPSPVDKSGQIAYFGRLTLGNLVDWCVTLCLGGILIRVSTSLGGVRPDTHLSLLPLFALALGLHGLWLAVEDELPKRLSHVPFYYLPLLLWMVASAMWISPTAWLGWLDVIYALEAFIFIWVLTNNVRTRAHLWVFLLMALLPAAQGVFYGFYQFFQDPHLIAKANGLYSVELSPLYLGQATGTFADPNTYAVYLLVLLPLLIVAAAVPRFPLILRIMAGYVALMFVVGIVLAQVLWAWAVCVLLLFVAAWFCFRKLSHRLLFSGITCFVLLISLGVLVAFSPRYSELYASSKASLSEGGPLALWSEVLQAIADRPLVGAGGGSFAVELEQSPRVTFASPPEHAHSDVLQLLAEYGLLGGILFVVPTGFILFRAYRRCQAEPARIKRRGIKGLVMPPERFFLSIGLAGLVAFLICFCVSFVWAVPALTLYGAVFLAVLVKASFNRKIPLPSGWIAGLAYLVVMIGLGVLFDVMSTPQLESRSVELYARKCLDELVEQRAHISGNDEQMDAVIAAYTEAVALSPGNADAWIGLSAAQCQVFFRQPERYREIGMLAVGSAQHAVDLSDAYWRAWAQLGGAYALAGEYAQAESALVQALELAPNNSNANYQFAAFMSHFPDRQNEALSMVRRALEINPENMAARRLQQKLLIL